MNNMVQRPGSTGEDWLPEEDGSYVAATHAHPSVLATEAEALAANTNRRYALFVNDSDTIIYLMLGAAAVANQGIRLNANGGSYEMSRRIGNLYRGSVHAIAAAAGGKNLLVTEGV